MTGRERRPGLPEQCTPSRCCSGALVLNVVVCQIEEAKQRLEVLQGRDDAMGNGAALTQDLGALNKAVAGAGDPAGGRGTGWEAARGER